LRVVVFASLAKLIPLIVLVLFAARFVDPANLQWTIAPNADNVGAGSLLLFYAFLGMETGLITGGEIRDPRRTVPRGLLFGLLMILLLYISIQLVVQGVLGADLQLHKASPLGAVAGIAFGAAGVVAIVLVSFISMSGTLGSNVLSVPRILYAAGREGAMPKWLGRVHPRFRTPHIAIMVYVTIGCTVALTGSFRQLAIISSASVLLIYLGVVLALLKERLSPESTAANTFRTPGGVFTPVLAAGGIVWLLSNLSGDELLGMALFAVLLSVLYGLGVLLKRGNEERRANVAAATAIDMKAS
jgi:amino acid transporter